MTIKEYKIDKDVPLIRMSGHGFDTTLPEYIVMMKMKIGKQKSSRLFLILLSLILLEGSCIFSLIWFHWPVEEEIEIIGF